MESGDHLYVFAGAVRCLFRVHGALYHSIADWIGKGSDFKEIMEYASEKKVCDFCGVQEVKLRACSKCRLAFYCSVECQKTHWKQKYGGHKKLCIPIDQHKPTQPSSDDIILCTRAVEFLTFIQLVWIVEVMSMHSEISNSTVETIADFKPIFEQYCNKSPTMKVYNRAFKTDLHTVLNMHQSLKMEGSDAVNLYDGTIRDLLSLATIGSSPQFCQKCIIAIRTSILMSEDMKRQFIANWTPLCEIEPEVTTQDEKSMVLARACFRRYIIPAIMSEVRSF